MVAPVPIRFPPGASYHEIESCGAAGVALSIADPAPHILVFVVEGELAGDEMIACTATRALGQAAAASIQ